jgi:trk system potassium uptake protein TrkH
MPKRLVSEPQIWQSGDRHFVTDAQVRQTALFVFLYLITYCLICLIIAGHGYSLGESLFETASAMSTVGLSVGVTTPDAPPTLLWTEIIAMFLGRLEFITVFVGVIRLGQDLGPMIRGTYRER